MNLNFTIEIWEKERWFVARCPEFDFVSQGKTQDEAKANLLEVIQIQFGEMTELGTLEDYLAECGYEKVRNVFIPLHKRISSEEYSFKVA